MAKTTSASPRSTRGRSRGAVPGTPAHLSLLGIRARDTVELMRRIEQGLPFGSLARFQRAIDLHWDRVAELVRIKPRTLTRRKAERRLQPDESERLLRVARTYQLAVDLFDGDADAARRWLSSPKKALAGRTPLDFMRSEVGAREVEHLIGRLEHGVFS